MHTLTGIAHVGMVQSWLPASMFYFSYNAAVAWSISTELLFYVAFPFLIRNWRRTWHVRLAGAFLLLMALVLLVEGLDLADYVSPGVGRDGWVVTTHGLIYVNPLARLLEFVTGMVISLAASRAFTRMELGLDRGRGDSCGPVCRLPVLRWPGRPFHRDPVHLVTYLPWRVVEVPARRRIVSFGAPKTSLAVGPLATTPVRT